MFGMGPWELALVVVAILLLFGAKRLPEIAQNMGKGIREFKRAMKEEVDDAKGGNPPAASNNKNDQTSAH
jgi:sec-independent protein translocase protein TatA